MRIKKKDNVTLDLALEGLTTLQQRALNIGEIVNVGNEPAVWLVAHGYCTHRDENGKIYDIPEG
jgi:hypothetical protein